MMATRSLATAFPIGGRNALDLPVAALAGLSVAFVVFVAPAQLLGDLVGATGIASVISAAEPPLGLKARIAIGVGAAAVVFALAYFLMRAIDRIGAPRAEVKEEDGDEPVTSRLRRRDLHPDAPPRPPLLATLELCDPEPRNDDWLQSPDQAKVSPPQPAARWADRWPEPATPAPVPAAKPSPLAEPIGEEAFVPAAPAAPAKSTSPPAPAPVAGPAPTPTPTRSAEPAPTESARLSLEELMERLERGLVRRRAASSGPVLADPATDEPADDRLQSAIESLHRFAARQGN